MTGHIMYIDLVLFQDMTFHGPSNGPLIFFFNAHSIVHFFIPLQRVQGKSPFARPYYISTGPKGLIYYSIIIILTDIFFFLMMYKQVQGENMV